MSSKDYITFPHIEGVLITTDVPTKLFILSLNEFNQNKLVLRDLDEISLLVDGRFLDFINEEVQKSMDRIHYERPNEEKTAQSK